MQDTAAEDTAAVDTVVVDTLVDTLVDTVADLHSWDFFPSIMKLVVEVEHFLYLHSHQRHLFHSLDSVDHHLSQNHHRGYF